MVKGYHYPNFLDSGPLASKRVSVFNVELCVSFLFVCLFVFWFSVCVWSWEEGKVRSKL